MCLQLEVFDGLHWFTIKLFKTIISAYVVCTYMASDCTLVDPMIIQISF